MALLWSLFFLVFFDSSLFSFIRRVHVLSPRPSSSQKNNPMNGDAPEISFVQSHFNAMSRLKVSVWWIDPKKKKMKKKEKGRRKRRNIIIRSLSTLGSCHDGTIPNGLRQTTVLLTSLPVCNEPIDKSRRVRKLLSTDWKEAKRP